MDYFDRIRGMARLGMDMTPVEFYQALAYTVDTWAAANDIDDSTVEFILKTILGVRKEVENEVGKISQEDLDALRAAKVTFKKKKKED